MREPVTVFEVGPRDGLQNEAQFIPTPQKVQLVDLLSKSGLKKIEVTSFVSPKWVPQMADAADVMARISRHDCVSYTALTPNMTGFERAVDARADEVAIFGSASEGFSQKNINCSIAESIERFAIVAEAALEEGMLMRGYVSCVTDCPYDGPTAPAQVARVAEALLEMGCYEISLGDTIGSGTPETVDMMIEAVRQAVPVEQLAAHFHDTHNRAIANIETALDHGIRVFDSAVGGLGGCPYAPGAKGNVATEAVVARLEDLGLDTGVDPAALSIAAGFAQALRAEP